MFRYCVEHELHAFVLSKQNDQILRGAWSRRYKREDIIFDDAIQIKKKSPSWRTCGQIPVLQTLIVCP